MELTGAKRDDGADRGEAGWQYRPGQSKGDIYDEGEKGRNFIQGVQKAGY